MARLPTETEAALYRLWTVHGGATRPCSSGRGPPFRAALVALICDTGPLYAAMDQASSDHLRCAQLLSDAADALVVPAPVLVELDWLAGKRLGPVAMGALLLDIEEGAVRVVDLLQEDYSRVRELCAQYADLPLGLVDAAVVALTERLAETSLATLDHRHFSIVRPRHTPSLTLLPE